MPPKLIKMQLGEMGRGEATAFYLPWLQSPSCRASPSSVWRRKLDCTRQLLRVEFLKAAEHLFKLRALNLSA